MLPSAASARSARSVSLSRIKPWINGFAMTAMAATLSLLVSKVPKPHHAADIDEPSSLSAEAYRSESRLLPRSNAVETTSAAVPAVTAPGSSSPALTVPAAPVAPVFKAKTAVIRRTFGDAAQALGLDAASTVALTHAFSNQLDFRRDIRNGELLTIVRPAAKHPSAPSLADGAPFTNLPLAARIGSGKDAKTVILYHPKGEKASYFTPDGAGTQASFSRYPLTFTRVSSPFSAHRLDPITHRWQSHDGVDLAAPTGTPVHASAAGKIVFVGRETGYGRLVIINNAAPYSTRFAHLSRFRKGLTVGMHIKRGQVIGYVGQSGWATGPHLHYEVRINDVAMNPLTVNLPRQPELHGHDRQQFAQRSAELIALL
jgi:murein DD-endopeptidase MepM/ murein hydrolase activator NlpD